MKEGVLMMVVHGQFWFIGRMAGTRINRPRIYRIIENGTRIQLEPFPHLPKYIVINGGFFSYPIDDREQNLIKLYEQVTSDEAEAGYDPMAEAPKGRSGIVLPGGN